MDTFSTPKGSHRTARGNAPGRGIGFLYSALKGLPQSLCHPFRVGLRRSTTITRGVAPGCHVRPLQGQKSTTLVMTRKLSTNDLAP